MIDLKPFCMGDDDWSNRRALRHPFRYGEHVYATDGRILLRVKSADYPKVGDAIKGTPTLESINALGWRHAQVSAWREFEEFWPKPCAQCSGLKKHVCACGNTHNCHACDGSGFDPPFTKLKLGAAQITKEYAQLIRTLPNVTVETPTAFDQPIVFKFNGGEGLVMGVKP